MKYKKKGGRKKLKLKIKKFSRKKIKHKNNTRYFNYIFLLIISLIVIISSFLVISKFNFSFNKQSDKNNNNIIINENLKMANIKYNISDMVIKASYSQFLEDLILNVFFFDIENGFYIDVGANNPNVISVTKYFYLKGWNGINIEPLPEEYQKLVISRPRDINLNICAGEKEANITIYKESVGTTRKKYYSRWKKPMNTTMQTMSKICNNYIIKNKEIHFCKIDVEGGEREVLMGIDFVNYRPKVFLY